MLKSVVLCWNQLSYVKYFCPMFVAICPMFLSPKFSSEIPSIFRWSSFVPQQNNFAPEKRSTGWRRVSGGPGVGIWTTNLEFDRHQPDVSKEKNWTNEIKWNHLNLAMTPGNFENPFLGTNSSTSNQGKTMYVSLYFGAKLLYHCSSLRVELVMPHQKRVFSRELAQTHANSRF